MAASGGPVSRWETSMTSVLVVDDSPVDLRLMGGLLEKETDFEVRYAVDSLARLLELDSPRWCTGETDDQPCAAIVEPISGEAVATIVIEVVAREGEDE